MEAIQAAILDGFKSTAFERFNQLECNQVPVIVAYSGGLDSSVLLHACHQLLLQKEITQLSAAHVNHGLQSLNDSWEQHCLAVCGQYQIELQLKRFKLSDAGLVSENDARMARQQFFQQLLAKPSLLCLAHHLDDQVETMLFRMIRGTGVHGLAGIPQHRELAKGHIFRPLLGFSRANLEDYANKFGLAWVEDPSNQQSHYSRNFLRNNIIPQIESKWPEFSRSFNQLGRLASEQGKLLDEIAEQDLSDIQHDNQSLSAIQFNQLSETRRKNLLHYWVRKLTHNSPNAVEISQAISQVKNMRETPNSGVNNHSIKVKLGSGWLRSFQKRIFYSTHEEPKKLASPLRWLEINQPLDLGNRVRLAFSQVNDSNQSKNMSGLALRKPASNETVSVKAREGGEVAKPTYRSHSTELKKIYQELDIPTWKRDWLPIVYFNDKIACIPGVFVDQAFASRKEGFQIEMSVDLGVKS